MSGFTFSSGLAYFTPTYTESTLLITSLTATWPERSAEPPEVHQGRTSINPETSLRTRPTPHCGDAMASPR
eukprot:745895-Hanusia_phi.AAC.6